MVEALQAVKITVLIMLFYSTGITIYSYSFAELPGINYYLDPFNTATSNFNTTAVAGNVQNSLERQTDVPVISSLAMVYYSGNILLDFLLNFLFAIPEILTIIFNAFLMMFSGVDAQLTVYVQTFLSAVIVSLYVIGLMELLANVRTGAKVT